MNSSNPTNLKKSFEKSSYENSSESDSSWLALVRAVQCSQEDYNVPSENMQIPSIAAH